MLVHEEEDSDNSQMEFNWLEVGVSETGGLPVRE